MFFVACRNYDPENVDEVVDILFKLFSCELEKDAVKMDWFEFITKYHFNIGLFIRNCFGLWKKDNKIMKMLAVEHPDEASTLIMKKLWEKFRSEYRRL